MGLNRADITSYISRSEFNLPTGDVADLVESDYLALIQIGNLMTDLINKYSQFELLHSCSFNNAIGRIAELGSSFVNNMLQTERKIQPQFTLYFVLT